MEKIKALLLKLADGTTHVDLGDEQLNSVTSFINDGSYISTYGAALPIAEVSQGSVTINKNVAGKIEDKTSAGQGTINDAEITQETVFLGKTKKINEGLTAADMTSGFASAVSVKSAKHADQLRKFREREAFKGLALTFADADAADIGKGPIVSEDDAYKAYLAIVEQADTLSELVDEKQGLDTIDESMIFIDLQPSLFSTLVRLGFASGAGKDLLEKGRFLLANLGGYTVRSNPLIKGAVTSDGTPVIGFVSTTFAGLAPMRVTAMNAGRFDASNDVVVYSEAKFTSDQSGNLIGFKQVYTGVTKPIIAKV